MLTVDNGEAGTVRRLESAVVCGYFGGAVVAHVPREPLTFPLTRALCGAEGELWNLSTKRGSYRLCRKCERRAGEPVELPPAAEREQAAVERLTFRQERALADLLGGAGGGWKLWRVALQDIRLVVDELAAEEGSFRSRPEGMFRSLLGAIDRALEAAETAVSLQLFLEAEPDVAAADRGRDLAEMLLARARDLGAARTR